ncbi:hypothetical protein [Streptomyces sp. NPDC058548]|uniref:hypothetical protein n=1 Tax=unclassified Streptomyces TaxID=2593676 RepID=UPI003667800B
MTEAPQTAVRIHLREGEQPTPPMRADGTPYRYELAYDGGSRRAYADEFAALTAVLIPGYEELADEPARHAARVREAGAVRAVLQAQLIAHYGSAGCTPDQLAVLNSGELPLPALRGWHSPVPLVLVAGPGTAAAGAVLPQPEEGGVVLWLDPADDESYLDSLSDLQVVMLAERDA